MKIKPKIVGKIKEYTLNEIDLQPVDDNNDKSVNFELTPNDKGTDGKIDFEKKMNVIKDKFEKGNDDTISVSDSVLEYKIPDAPRYYSWRDVFTKGVRDQRWLSSKFLRDDIYSLAENDPFTDRDLSTIEKVYENPDFLTQDVLGGVGVILKNALARRSPLPEPMKVKLKSFDTMLSANAQNKGLNKKKRLERTMDVNLKAHYLKLQGIDSWAEARGNIMGLPENQNVIGTILKKEIDKILSGGEANLSLKQELYGLIKKQSDTKVKIKNRGEEAQPKDYIPVNLLLLYAVLLKDVNLVHIAIKAEGQEINPREQNRIKGKFTPKLETILSGLVEHDEMSEIRNILINANVITPKKIIPKLENKTMGKTIIITERQAKMLSLIKFNEDNSASKATKSLGYEKPQIGGYTTQAATGTDYAKELERKRNNNKKAAKNATAKDHESPEGIKKSLIVDKDVDTSKKLNDYFVKEGIGEYKVVNKSELFKQIFK